jgi:CRP-like cAMP-binding protein
MLTSTHKTLPKSFLAASELFKKLSPAALAEIERHAVEKHYKRNDSIFFEGDPAQSVWFVKSGYVKAVNHGSSGQCQTLCMTGVNGMFGSCCAFGQGQYPCHSVAVTDAVVVSVPMTDFMNLLSKYSEIGSALVRSLSERLRRSKDDQTFEKEPVEVRVLHILVNLVEQFGKTIPLTRREIAEMAGTTVETSIRTFLHLEKEGLVSTSRGKITVKDTQLLNDRIENR